MIPLYILGLLLRFGPQHGYQIKKLIEEQLADFTQIKLPTIYYHLEKLESSGYLSASRDKDGTRPEKTVYCISESGTKKFKSMLNGTLAIQYRPNFDIDSAFYFGDYLDDEEVLAGLKRHSKALEQSLNTIEQHRKETMKYIPEEMQVYANSVFEHHILHFKAELDWAKLSITSIKEDNNRGENKNN